MTSRLRTIGTSAASYNPLILVALLLTSLACFILPVPAAGKVSTSLPAKSTPTVIVTGRTPSLTAAPRPQCAVNTSVLNLRACAGTYCTTKTWLREGETIAILDSQAQWLQVETQTGDTGWVHSKFCTEKQP